MNPQTRFRSGGSEACGSELTAGMVFRQHRVVAMPQARSPHGSPVQENSASESKSPAHVSVPMEDMQGLDAASEAKARNKATWRKLNPGRIRVVMVAVVPVVLCMVMAFVIGLIYNLTFYGGAFGGNATPPAVLTVNLVECCCCSTLISCAVGLLRMGFKLKAPKSVYSIFSFLVYFLLTFMLLWDAMNGSVACMVPSAAGIANQATLLLKDEFDYAHEPTPTRFNDILQTQDFYNWLRGPISIMIRAGSQNRDPTFHAAAENAPMQLGSFRGGWANWVLPRVRLRQVRVELQDMESQQVLGQKGQVLVDFNKRVPEWSYDVEGKTARRFPVTRQNNYTESYMKNTFKNRWSAKLDPPDLTLRATATSGFMHYPGCSGQVLTSRNPMGIRQGSWSPMLASNSTALKAAVAADIDFMEANNWIDHLTSLVTVELAIWNPNNNLFLILTYPIEFLNSGTIVLNPPYVGANKVLEKHPYSNAFMPLIWAMFYFLCELQDLVMGGPNEYFNVNLSGNVVDLICVSAALAMSCCSFALMGFLPGQGEPNLWPVTGSMIAYQRASGLALFCAVFKMLQYTRKVPVMCHVGRTFAAASLDILLFLIVMLILFVAFAVMFYANFRLTMNDFASFPDTLFYIFRGLQGDMDAEALVSADPFMGPIIYSIYVTVLLYVGFTLLIGIVSIAYEEVREADLVDDEARRNGFIVTAVRKFKAACKADGLNVGPDTPRPRDSDNVWTPASEGNATEDNVSEDIVQNPIGPSEHFVKSNFRLSTRDESFEERVHTRTFQSDADVLRRIMEEVQHLQSRAAARDEACATKGSAPEQAPPTRDTTIEQPAISVIRQEAEDSKQQALRNILAEHNREEELILKEVQVLETENSALRAKLAKAESALSKQH